MAEKDAPVPHAGDDRSAMDALRERLQQPVARATELTRRTMDLFPVRVWQHFLRHNGLLLAAGVSYQALFAIVAAMYVAFATAGIWLGGSKEVIASLIHVIDSYVPGLISADGLVTPEQVEQVARESSGVLTITGLIALGVAIWTAMGFITFTRRAVRDIFVLPYDTRNFVLLKARDLLAAVIFGAALIIGSLLATVTSGFFSWVLSLFSVSPPTHWTDFVVRALSIVVAFAINTLALASLYRFMAGTSLHWGTIMPGAMLGGAGVAVLQLGAGYLLGYTPANPLLATFAIFIGFLLWFRLNGIVILIAASWIAVAANDRDLPMEHQTEEEKRQIEHAALLLAARVNLRNAKAARAEAPWWRHWPADAAVRRAEQEVHRLSAEDPGAARSSLLLE